MGRPPVARAGLTDARRRELIEAAFRQIADRGFEGLRTREVAAEVGVNVATLHYHLPTKESLIRGVLEHAVTRFRSTLAPHGSPATELRNHLRAVRRLLREEPELATVMAELGQRAGRDESIRSLLSEMFESWQATLRGLLRRGVRAGYLRPELDSDGVAALIMATLMAQTLPVLRSGGRGQQALAQLERWLESSN